VKLNIVLNRNSFKRYFQNINFGTNAAIPLSQYVKHFRLCETIFTVGKLCVAILCWSKLKQNTISFILKKHNMILVLEC
jgi:hypothetical protein